MLDVSHTLITHDERVIRNMLKEILEFEGYKISLANIWREALDCIQKHKIDLIFLYKNERDGWSRDRKRNS